MGAVEVLLRIKDDATAALKGVGEEGRKAASAIEATKQASEGLLQLELAKDLLEVGKAFGEWYVGALQARSELVNVAAATGTTVQQLQGLQQAARASGVEISDMAEAAKLVGANTEQIRVFSDQLALLGGTIAPNAAEETQRWNQATAELVALWEGVKEAVLGTSGTLAAGIQSFVTGTGYAAVFVSRVVNETVEGIRETAVANLVALGQSAALVASAATGDLGAIARIAAGDIPALTSVGSGGERLSDVLAVAQSEADAWAAAQAQNRAAVAGTSPPVLTGGGSSASGGAGRTATSTGTSSTGQPVYVSVMVPPVEAEAGTGPTGMRWSDGQSRDAFAAMEAERRAASLAAAAGGVRAASGVLTGDLAGIASMAGPIGAVVGQAMSALQTLGREGAEGIGDRIRESVDALLAGIRELPKLLTEVLPDLIADLVPAITEALIAALPELIVAQYEAVYRAGMALVKAVFVDLPEIIAASVVRAVLKAWESIKLVFTQPFGGKGVGGWLESRDWERTGLTALRVLAGVATLGASEVVIAAGRGAAGAAGYGRGASAARSTAPSSTARTREADSAGLGGTHIHFHGPVVGGEQGVRDLMRHMRRMSGARGLGESV